MGFREGEFIVEVETVDGECSSVSIMAKSVRRIDQNTVQAGDVTIQFPYCKVVGIEGDTDCVYTGYENAIRIVEGIKCADQPQHEEWNDACNQIIKAMREVQP